MSGILWVSNVCTEYAEFAKAGIQKQNSDAAVPGEIQTDDFRIALEMENGQQLM